MASSDLAGRYHGTTATQYEEQRTSEPSWTQEQAVVASMLETFPNDSTVIDVPVGTGRFFEFYRVRGFHLTGVDISADMLAQARIRAQEFDLSVALEEGDIRHLRFADRAFDGAVCIRLLNLIEFTDVRGAVRELARISKRHVVLGVRCFIPRTTLIRRPGGFMQLARQGLRRLRAAVSTPLLLIHPLPDMLDTLRRSGLGIVRAVPIQQFADGSELVVYLLDKNAEAGMGAAVS